jgi:hypothetical protein
MRKTLYGVASTEACQCTNVLWLWEDCRHVRVSLCGGRMTDDPDLRIVGTQLALAVDISKQTTTLSPTHYYYVQHHQTSPSHLTVTRTYMLRYRCLKLGYVISTHARTKPEQQTLITKRGWDVKIPPYITKKGNAKMQKYYTPCRNAMP